MSELNYPLATAHEIMQMHRGCTVETCRLKRAAYRALMEHGVLVPDQRVEKFVR